MTAVRKSDSFWGVVAVLTECQLFPSFERIWNP